MFACCHPALSSPVVRRSQLCQNRGLVLSGDRGRRTMRIIRCKPESNAHRQASSSYTVISTCRCAYILFVGICLGFAQCTDAAFLCHCLGANPAGECGRLHVLFYRQGCLIQPKTERSCRSGGILGMFISHEFVLVTQENKLHFMLPCLEAGVMPVTLMMMVSVCACVCVCARVRASSLPRS